MPLELPPEDFDLLADRVCRAASDYLAGLSRACIVPRDIWGGDGRGVRAAAARTGRGNRGV